MPGLKPAATTQRNRLAKPAGLERLISEWAQLQARLELKSRSEVFPDQGGGMEQTLSEKMEENLSQEERALLQKIVEYPCGSTRDVMAKLTVWKGCVAPGHANIAGFSLANQIALSAAIYLEALEH